MLLHKRYLTAFLKLLYQFVIIYYSYEIPSKHFNRTNYQWHVFKGTACDYKKKD
jgi:hypothetical protein